MLKYPSEPINFIKLAAENPQEAEKLLQDPNAILYDLPACLVGSEIPNTSKNEKTVGFRGKIIRTQKPKILETSKLFTCNKCNAEIKVEYDPVVYNQIIKPRKCTGDSQEPCSGTKFTEVVQDPIIKDYQEIKVQEQIQNLQVGRVPRSVTVVLEDHLVDTCKPGDDILITARVFQRWKRSVDSIRCQVETCLLAKHLHIISNSTSTSILNEEMVLEFVEYWERFDGNPLVGRDRILSCFCPQVFGMYIIKLSIMLVLIGGVEQIDSSGHKIRGDSHLLLVGDPGTGNFPYLKQGKSQFLRYADLVSPRSVFTTGIGSTSAGLTCTAVKEGSEWQLEAGALVLADRGVCCIDEFSSIREHDKSAIHEAMEQQSISVAKAGLVTKLNTRCSIIAATNPKGKYNPELGIEVNTALASPLLSRFDLILVLLDAQNNSWDEQVSNFILEAETNEDFGEADEVEELEFPLQKLSTFILFCKSFNPVMSEEANEILKNYYQIQRSSDLRNAARTTIRLLESLVRLAQAHARFMCRRRVEIMDAVVAIMVVEASMQSTALAGVVSTLHVPFPEDPDMNYRLNEAQILGKLGCIDLVSKTQTFAKANAFEILNQNLNMDFEQTQNPGDISGDVEIVPIELVEQREEIGNIQPQPNATIDEERPINQGPSSPEVFFQFPDTPQKDLTEPDENNLPSQTPLMPLGMLGESGKLLSRQILGSSEFDLFSQE